MRNTAFWMLALASTAGAGEPPVQQIEVRARASDHDTAAKVVVDSAELARYGDDSVAAALKRVPGVTVVSTGRGSDIRMRGLGAGYTQILVNGQTAPFGFSLDSLAPAQVERIEVIRSATAEFSTQSIAGTINVVLRKVARERQRQVQLGYGGDHAERTTRGLLLLSDRVGKLSYGVTANLRSSLVDRYSSVDDTIGTTHTPGRFDEQLRFTMLNLVPRAGWRMDGGDTLSLEGMLTASDTRFDGVERTQEHTALAQVRGRSRMLKTDLIWNARLAGGARLEARTGVTARDERRRHRAGPQAPQSGIDSDEQALNGAARLSWRAADIHQVTVGIDSTAAWRRDRAWRADAFDSDMLRGAAFVQDEWQLRPHWSAYLGARVEHLALTSAVVENRSTVWSPVAQTLYKFPALPGAQLRLALTRTFKAPGAAALSPLVRADDINRFTAPDQQGNPALRPEIARGADATFEHHFGKQTLVSVGLSGRAITDYTLTELRRQPDGRWLARPRNAGKARIHTLELEARFPLTLISARAAPVDARVSLARNWSQVEQVPGPGNRVGQQVPLSLLLALDYVRPALSMGVSVAARRGALVRLTPAYSTVSRTRHDVDMYLLWSWQGGHQLRLTAGNMLGQDETSVARFDDGTFDAARSTVSKGRASVRALYEVKF